MASLDWLTERSETVWQGERSVGNPFDQAKSAKHQVMRTEAPSRRRGTAGIAWLELPPGQHAEHQDMQNGQPARFKERFTVRGPARTSQSVFHVCVMKISEAGSPAAAFRQTDHHAVAPSPHNTSRHHRARHGSRIRGHRPAFQPLLREVHVACGPVDLQADPLDASAWWQSSSRRAMVAVRAAGACNKHQPCSCDLTDSVQQPQDPRCLAASGEIVALECSCDIS